MLGKRGRSWSRQRGHMVFFILKEKILDDGGTWIKIGADLSLAGMVGIYCENEEERRPGFS